MTWMALLLLLLTFIVTVQPDSWCQGITCFTPKQCQFINTAFNRALYRDNLASREVQARNPCHDYPTKVVFKKFNKTLISAFDVTTQWCYFGMISRSHTRKLSAFFGFGHQWIRWSMRAVAYSDRAAKAYSQVRHIRGRGTTLELGALRRTGDGMVHYGLYGRVAKARLRKPNPTKEEWKIIHADEKRLAIEMQTTVRDCRSTACLYRTQCIKIRQAMTAAMREKRLIPSNVWVRNPCGKHTYVDNFKTKHDRVISTFVTEKYTFFGVASRKHANLSTVPGFIFPQFRKWATEYVAVTDRVARGYVDIATGPDFGYSISVGALRRMGDGTIQYGLRISAALAKGRKRYNTRPDVNIIVAESKRVAIAMHTTTEE